MSSLIHLCENTYVDPRDISSISPVLYTHQSSVQEVIGSLVSLKNGQVLRTIPKPDQVYALVQSEIGPSD